MSKNTNFNYHTIPWNIFIKWKQVKNLIKNETKCKSMIQKWPRKVEQSHGQSGNVGNNSMKRTIDDFFNQLLLLIYSFITLTTIYTF